MLRKQVYANSIAKNSRKFFKNNGATILSGIASLGVIASTVTAIKATPKALARLEEVKKEKSEELSKKEIIQSTIPIYIPTIAISLSTIACILGANALNKKQQASLISAYALLSDNFNGYRKGAIDVYGEDADSKIKTEIAKKTYINTQCGYQIYDLNMDRESEELLFFDFYSKRYFNATIAEVINAEYHLNRMLNLRGEININTFYEYLGLEPIKNGDGIGWNGDYMLYAYNSMWLDFDNRLASLEDGMECYIISMAIDPIPFSVIEKEYVW